MDNFVACSTDISTQYLKNNIPTNNNPSVFSTLVNVIIIYGSPSCPSKKTKLFLTLSLPPQSWYPIHLQVLLILSHYLLKQPFYLHCYYFSLLIFFSLTFLHQQFLFSIATLSSFNHFYNDEKNLTLLTVVVRVSSEEEILFMRICLDKSAWGQLNAPQDRDIYRNQTSKQRAHWLNRGKGIPSSWNIPKRSVKIIVVQ